MKILDLKQGTDEWQEARLECFTASEAAAMMNQSKFMSRNQLLDLKKGWAANPDSKFKAALYQKGHDHEASAREIIEIEMLQDLPPVVGSVIIDGIEYLASFDGYNEGIIWEHKDWNATLAENVRNCVLEPHYFWQLEHQMLVAGTTKCTFTVSDGTRNNRVSMVYKSTPERRADLIAGWIQFEIDLEKHELKAKEEKVILSSNFESFPIVAYSLEGMEVKSNIKECLLDIKERSGVELNRKLESDQDFVDKKDLNKAVKKSRELLKQSVAKVQSEFESLSIFANDAKEIDVVLQKMQSHGEKLVKNEEARRKEKFKLAAETSISELAEKLNLEISPIKLELIMTSGMPDFDLAMKNKRTKETIQNSIDSVVAAFKIEADAIAASVKINLSTLRELAGEHKFLFNDTQQLVTKDNESLIAIIKSRIADYKKEQEDKKVEPVAIVESEQTDIANQTNSAEYVNTSSQSNRCFLSNSGLLKTALDFLQNIPLHTADEHVLYYLEMATSNLQEMKISD